LLKVRSRRSLSGDFLPEREKRHLERRSREKGLASEVRVVLLKVLSAGLGHLDCDELEALVLEARDDGSNKAPLDTIGLDGNESLLVGHFELEFMD